MARPDSDHPRADHLPGPQEHPEDSLYVIDVDGAAATPAGGDPFAEFVSEFPDAPPVSSVVHEPRLRADPADSRRSTAARAVAPANAFPPSSQWVDTKTMVTVAITMVLTVFGMAVGLRFAAERRGVSLVAAGSSAAAGDVIPVGTSVVSGEAPPAGAVETPDGSDVRLEPTVRAAVPAEETLPSSTDGGDDSGVADAGRAPPAGADSVPARFDPDPFDWDRAVDARRLALAASASRAGAPVAGSSATGASSRSEAPAIDTSGGLRDAAVLAGTVAARPPLDGVIAPAPPPDRAPSSPPEAFTDTVPVAPAAVPVPEVETPPAIPDSPGLSQPAAAAPDEANAADAAAARAPARVQDVIDRYQEALSRLDANAAKVVWPSVDVQALERAFGSLETQRVELRDCRITVDEARARASCGGTLRYVPRVGRKSERVEQRQFEFELRRVDDIWSIDQVESR